MKKFLTFLFGDIGLMVSSTVCVFILAAMLPLFLAGIQASILLKILSWSLAFPLVLASGLSALSSAGTLIYRGTKKETRTSKTVYILFGIFILLVIVFVLVITLV